ncbi:hypothetical protein PLANPX_0544 [Lacipirellula parvula]|uniref:Uncharacterized protein n=2 Tax=Lacipirellula parvula TaxID=2650471 RepID=A0A5K7X528_9BACT|nr:hypothetical protein PLANPX_0544 [Lacipirellula parvula]
MFPEITQEPTIRNPFPQLRRVAVAPFFNQSDSPTVDGREFAMAYFTELQLTPGFEVVPLGVVEEAIIAHRIDLNRPGEARRLGQLLGVDAVAIGAVIDYAEYYPPRIGMRVEWYASNPGFHEIPAGYGLPWGTPEEEFIPDSLVYESQMALFRAEMQGISPQCDEACMPLPAPPTGNQPTAPAPLVDPSLREDHSEDDDGDGAGPAENNPFFDPNETSSIRIVDQNVQRADLEVEMPETTKPTRAPSAKASSLKASSLKKSAAKSQPKTPQRVASNAAAASVPQAVATAPAVAAGALGAAAAAAAGYPLPPEACACGPDNNFGGLYAMGPGRAACVPFNGPVLSHSAIYNGADDKITEALEGYVFFRDDQRYGGWQPYLSRSNEFIRFCCHLHICEMLSARGGGSAKMDVLMRWPERR